MHSTNKRRNCDVLKKYVTMTNQNETKVLRKFLTEIITKIPHKFLVKYKRTTNNDIITLLELRYYNKV